MRAEPVDPRTDAEWGTDPTVNYRVIFWLTENHSNEYDLLDAADVHAAIAWTDAEGDPAGGRTRSTRKFVAAKAPA